MCLHSLLRRRALFFHRDPASLSKVGQNDSAYCSQVRHENIFRFDVSVSNSLLVKVVDCLKYLAYNHGSIDFGQVAIFAGIKIREEVASRHELLKNVANDFSGVKEKTTGYIHVVTCSENAMDRNDIGLLQSVQHD